MLPRLFRAALLLAALSSLMATGCVSLNPSDPHLTAEYDEQAKIAGRDTIRVAVCCKEVQATTFHKPSSGLSNQLDENLRRRLAALGLEIVNSEKQADFVVSANVRIWPSNAGYSALVGTLTLSAYLPLWYTWVIEVNIRDSKGLPVTDSYEKGKALWHCWTPLVLPVSATEYGAVFCQEQVELTDWAAKITAAKVADYANWQRKIVVKPSETRDLKPNEKPDPSAAPKLNILAQTFAPDSEQTIKDVDVRATLIYEAAGGNTAANHALWREDELRYKDPDKGPFQTVKQFAVDKTLQASGTAVANCAVFTFPSAAPDGEYLLVSKIYDPSDEAARKDQAEFHFSVSAEGKVSLPSQK